MRYPWLRRFGGAVALALGLGLAPNVLGQQASKEHQFKGKVEKVDVKAKTLTVNGENVPGWMAAMTMLYKVDNSDVVKAIKVGDQITAKVYDGDVTTLHDVRVVPPSKDKSTDK